MHINASRLAFTYKGLPRSPRYLNRRPFLEREFEKYRKRCSGGGNEGRKVANMVLDRAVEGVKNLMKKLGRFSIEGKLWRK